MALSKQIARELYRPLGPKPIQLNVPIPGNLNTSGVLNFNQQVDLSLPIRGIQLRFSGRDTVVTGNDPAHASPPEGFLGFINNISISGVNARQQGNVTLWSAPLSYIFSIMHLHAYRAAIYTIAQPLATPAVPETMVGRPSTPMPALMNPLAASGAAGTFDFKIVMDIPYHPLQFHGFGKSPFSVPLFAMRNEEWKDSVQIHLGFTGQPNGAAAGPLGTGLAATTHTFSSYGSTTGSPSIDLYSLPFLSGLTAKDSYLPGLISRVAFPISSSLLASSAVNATLINLQKQPTPRIYVKVGTSSVPDVFDTLSDNIITALGIQLGGNRNIRNAIDIFAHKEIQVADYGVDPVVGYNLLDFVQNGNYDSGFPGQDIGDGATFVVQTNITGTAGAACSVLQEQMLHAPTGPLAS